MSWESFWNKKEYVTLELYTAEQSAEQELFFILGHLHGMLKNMKMNKQSCKRHYLGKNPNCVKGIGIE